MVSIVLPNLNTSLNYLTERLDTIFSQIRTDWECIVIDGFSENGSWELIKSRTKDDDRFSLFQLPRKGIYDAWNEGIKRASGEFVYIATSDDTMSVDLLDIMTGSLNQHPDCGLAHCGLTIIDEYGREVSQSKWEEYWISQYLGPLIHQPHKRLAPHDGILHMAVQTVYTSITQLLIRRTLFDDVGLFLTNGGPVADFEWGMRASLIANVVYIPQKLATWRLHSDQATSDDYNNTAAHRALLCRLAVHAFSILQSRNCGLYKRLNMKTLFYVFRRDQFYYELAEVKSKWNKIRLVAKWSCKHSYIVLEYIAAKIGLIRDPFDRVNYIREYIKILKLDKSITIIK